jgi:arylsulfatase A-like enzyme
MRVPLIVHYPAGIRSAVKTDAFAYVTDITPTLLEVAGVALPAGSHDGREVHEVTGKSMLGFLRGEEDRVHDPEDAVAYELAGSAAVFRADYKLMRNNPPFGDRQWRLYHYTRDILELDDLAVSEPAIFADMVAAYERYADEVHLIEVPDDYNVMAQLQRNVARNQGKEKTDEVPAFD